MSVCKVCRNVLLPGVPHQLLTSVTPRNLQVESYRYTNSLLYGSICPLQPPTPATLFLLSFFTISLSFSLVFFVFLFVSFVSRSSSSSSSSLSSFSFFCFSTLFLPSPILFSLVFLSTFDLFRFDRLRWSPDAKRERKIGGYGRDDKKVSFRHDLLRIENVT